jgi:hypothetical protein
MMEDEYLKGIENRSLSALAKRYLNTDGPPIAHWKTRSLLSNLEMLGSMALTSEVRALLSVAIEQARSADTQMSRDYEQLRQVIDGGSESMTHECALNDLKIMSAWWDYQHKTKDTGSEDYKRGWNDAIKEVQENRDKLRKGVV